MCRLRWIFFWRLANNFFFFFHPNRLLFSFLTTTCTGAAEEKRKFHLFMRSIVGGEAFCSNWTEEISFLRHPTAIRRRTLKVMMMMAMLNPVDGPHIRNNKAAQIT